MTKPRLLKIKHIMRYCCTKDLIKSKLRESEIDKFEIPNEIYTAAPPCYQCLMDSQLPPHVGV